MKFQNRSLNPKRSWMGLKEFETKSSGSQTPNLQLSMRQYSICPPDHEGASPAACKDRLNSGHQVSRWFVGSKQSIELLRQLFLGLKGDPNLENYPPAIKSIAPSRPGRPPSLRDGTPRACTRRMMLSIPRFLRLGFRVQGMFL